MGEQVLVCTVQPCVLSITFAHNCAPFNLQKMDGHALKSTCTLCLRPCVMVCLEGERGGLLSVCRPHSG